MLENIALFQGLSPEALLRWEAHCKSRTYGKGEFIVQEDDKSCDVFFLISGRAQVVSIDESGDVVPYRDIAAGGQFGEFAAIDKKPRSANVIATETCVIGSISAGSFLKLLESDCIVLMALLKQTIAQTRSLSERVFDYSIKHVPERILEYLVRLAEEEGVVHGREVHLPTLPRQQDIADLLSMNREAVPREIGELKRAGVVEWRGELFVIRDLGLLQHKLGEYRSRRLTARRKAS